MSDVTAPMNLRVEEPRLSLPPGFRFHPTDEEVVTSYLTPKALDSLFSCVVVADVDLNKIEPWDLPSKAKMGAKEWYFFVRKDRKYPTGSRTNRATASGYWKATGKDKEIFRGRDCLVGMKKTLVFYLGRAPRGEKTPWVMHEYRLEGHLPPRLHRAAKDKWAVCRVFNKDLAAKAGHTAAPAAGMERTDSIALLEDLLDSSGLPPLTDFSQFCVDDLMDFKGAAGTSGGGGYQPVKAEQQNQPQVLQGDPTNYFPLPAPGYLHPQAAAGEQHEAAIRRHSTAVAPAPLSSPSRGADMPLRQQQPLYPDLDGLPDYSDMWKF